MLVVLLQAVRWDRMEMVAELLARGAEIFDEERDGYQPESNDEVSMWV